jgi:hypothetical protein
VQLILLDDLTDTPKPVLARVEAYADSPRSPTGSPPARLASAEG